MRFFLLIAVLALSSCVYPIQPWKSRDDLIKTGRDHLLVPMTADDARNMVIGLYEVLSQAKQNRDLQSLVGQEITFYGTLIAVAGIATDSRAARNTGGVLAGLASLLTGHYKPADQALIFDKAAQRVDCLKELLRPITPEARRLFAADFGASTDAKMVEIVKGYNDIPVDTIEFVDTISKDLNAALQSVTLSSPSKEDLANTMKGWKDSKDKPKPDVDNGTVAKGMLARNLAAGDPDAKLRVYDEMQAFLAAVRDYHNNGAACLAQHTQ